MRQGGGKNQLFEVLNRGNHDDDQFSEDRQEIFIGC